MKEIANRIIEELKDPDNFEYSDFEGGVYTKQLNCKRLKLVFAECPFCVFQIYTLKDHGMYDIYINDYLGYWKKRKIFKLVKKIIEIKEKEKFKKMRRN